MLFDRDSPNMAISDWEDWLPRAVADAAPETVALWYLGCNGFAIKGSGGTTLWIDPYLGTGDPPRTVRMIPVPFDPRDVASASALLATHEHTDHVHAASQAPLLEGTGADFIAPDASVDVVNSEGWTETWNLSDSQFHTVSPGSSLSVGEFEIDVVAVNDPDAQAPVGYVISHSSGTIFHGGDSKPAEIFSQHATSYDIDVGILAFGSSGVLPDKATGDPSEKVWYSDENQITQAARDLQIDRLVPTHWDMWKGMTADPKSLHAHTASYEYPRQLEIIEIGDRIDL